MYARQWALTLFLIVFFGPNVFYIQCTTQQSHHRLNNSCHHAIFLLGLTSQTNQGHIAERKGLCSRQDHTLFVFKVIKEILQLQQVYLNFFNAHLLSLKAVGTKIKKGGPSTHWLRTHLLGLILIISTSMIMTNEYELMCIA